MEAAINKLAEDFERMVDHTNTRFDAIATPLLEQNKKKKKKRTSDIDDDNSCSNDDRSRKIDDRGIKLDDFTGLGSPEDFLEWARQLEKISDYNGFDD